MKIKFSNRYLSALLSYTAIVVLKTILLTCRVRYINKKYIDEYLLGDKKVVLSTWHRCTIYFMVKYGYLHPMALLSPSKDGDLLADFSKRLGFAVARGSSSRGGKQGSEHLVNFLNSGGRIATTVADGPLGPALRAKPGLVRIAQKSGVHLMPLVWSATRVWVFTKAWDRTIIPKPFSRIVIAASRPYIIPKTAQGEEFDAYVKDMERSLNVMTREVDEMVGHHDSNVERIIQEDGLK
jgi:lysophospholipid acyltransferase (LPLAT)-like uncharacterized protein